LLFKTLTMLLVIFIIKELQLSFEYLRKPLEVLDEFLGFIDLDPKLFYGCFTFTDHDFQFVCMSIFELLDLVLKFFYFDVVFFVDLHFLKFFFVL
jgi:hypothetical protein